MAIEDYGSRLAADARALDGLRAQARTNPREALKAAAQQFESYFAQMMLKSMRETLSQDTMLDNEQTKFYTGMFDQQLAQNLGGKGAFGFARMLEQQLGKSLPETSAGLSTKTLPDLPQRPLAPEVERVLREMSVQRPPQAAPMLPMPISRNSAPAAAAPVAVISAAGASGNSRDFVAGVWPHAVEASTVTGIPPHLVVAHAALESGWGKSEPRRADGSPSYNLFGIKAGKSWNGETVEASTTEYVNGRAETRTERFRAYGSYREAFVDYANLLSTSSRYSGVVSASDGTDFANSLQQSGYATDPMYASKLVRIINGKTLRDALTG